MDPSQNALTHGIFATAVVLPGIERREDWERHRAGIFESLQPEGYLEEQLVEQVAQLYWRLARVARFETSSLTLAQQADLHQIETDYASEHAHLLRHVAYSAPSTPSTQSTAPTPNALTLIAQLRARIGRLAVLPPQAADTTVLAEDAQWLLACCHPPVPRLSARPDDAWLDADLPGVAVGRGRLAFDGWTHELLHASVVALTGDRESVGGRDPWLPEFLDQFDLHLAALEQELTARLDEARTRALVPDLGVLDKVVRYEAHLNRQLRAAMKELAGLQERRAKQKMQNETTPTSARRSTPSTPSTTSTGSTPSTPRVFSASSEESAKADFARTAGGFLEGVRGLSDNPRRPAPRLAPGPVRAEHAVDGVVDVVVVEPLGFADRAFVAEAEALRDGAAAGVLHGGADLDAV